MDRRLITLTAVLALGLVFPAVASAQCARTITADVVAMDQVFFWNRLGAVQPQGMIYALRRDVVPLSGGSLTPGNVVLREGKRPRPLVLRMGVGDCLEIHFQNLLAAAPMDDEQPATRKASIHVVGLELLSTILDDGSNVGSVAPPGSLVAPGQTAIYRLRADREGEHVMHSAAAMTGGEGEGGSTPPGLFGAVIVEPAGSVWYRSQVTRADMDHAQAKTIGGLPKFTASGHPVIDYDRVYPLGHPLQGQPVLRMLDANNELIYGDLRAIVTGSDPDIAPFGRFANGTYPDNPVLPDRLQPFREFVTIYHDEIGAVQAFPIFTDPIFAHPTHGVRDAFAINYGTGGIGAEILANRFKVGPMWDCPECKYEEFFLSAWTVGDPAMVVDVPANAPCMIPTSNPNRIRQQPGFSAAIDDLKDWAIDGEEPCAADQGPKATKAFFPDDPSNVYPSYLGDHVKFRLLHAGPKEHHIHHQHAHQWVFAPDSDKSSYLDSQAIGPGASFTLEMTYNGSGNRNQTAGDSIFHCHFYPHFAMGMWGMWRVHDVFEWGTPLDSRGKPQERSRAYPDGEIAAGVPIPGIVPLPGLPMAPLPERLVGIVNGQVTFLTDGGNPGFPFFVPAIAGHRPPHPPLDFATTVDGVTPVPPIDGGLPRHVIRGGAATSVETRLDFSKVLDLADAIELPEAGTDVEVAAMEFHEKRLHPTCTPANVCDNEFGGADIEVNFVANGLPRKPGAPFADPCINDAGEAVGNRRFYSAANIQLDLTFNKVGWHFPQQRILTLVGDVDDTLAGLRPPEPLFFRGNTNDCIEYLHTNLVPHEYELDDYQVRTPTDILGQHIHLVKFDVMASDGAGNGWNYEDGTFSPGEVRERMHAIRAFNTCIGDEITGGDPRDGTFACPIAEAHPLWPSGGPDEDGDGVPDWLGAQTTVQRWYADDVLNLAGQDRTLRTVFTHDHYGPSTHQQVGLYAGLVIEPTGSTWHHQDNGTQFYTRFDGGPTSWRADIRTSPTANSFREFLLEFADFQHAYEEDNVGFPDPANAINPPAKEEAGLPFLVQRADRCPVLHGEELGIEGPEPPCPELISAADVGTSVVNYRNEPLSLRVRNPATNQQAAGDAGDLALAFSSRVDRADDRLDVQPPFYPPLTPRIGQRDPYTPLLQAFENDKVQIRILVGAHEEGHNFGVNGIKWRFEPSEPNSGWRNNQMMGISEHFEFEVPQLVKNPDARAVDYLWTAGSSTDDLWNGLWGILRVYKRASLDTFDPSSPDTTSGRPTTEDTLQTLPSNPTGAKPVSSATLSALDPEGICPAAAKAHTYSIVATTAAKALPPLPGTLCPGTDCGTLIYNSRSGVFGEGPLHDPTAILYFRSTDLDANGKLIAGRPIEPLVIRARAGECLKVTLKNDLPVGIGPMPDENGFATLPFIVDNFNNNQIRPSRKVGLHPQLVFYDVWKHDGNNVGVNPIQTVDPGGTRTYTWYAGDVFLNNNGSVTLTPIEFGATNLMPADRLKQMAKGAFGALIVEPPGASWTEDAASRASATVSATGVPAFREFVLMFQNFVNMKYRGDEPIPNTAEAEDAEDSGQKAFNYRTEPMWFRMGFAPGTPLSITRTFDFANVLNNSQVGGDPLTPIFTAAAGVPVRFRILHGGGNQRNNVWSLHGHAWEREPYTSNSTRLGESTFSMFQGSQFGIGPGSHFDALLRNGAGGLNDVRGDFLYRDFASFQFSGGLWGLMRVVGFSSDPGPVLEPASEAPAASAGE